jgi:hypothetical protein
LPSPSSGGLRDELLNETLFRSLAHTRAVLKAWRADYNHERPPVCTENLIRID